MARAGGPSLADALEVEAAKMVRRHPHVFSDTTYESQSEQLKDWDRIKREEKAAADAEGPKGTYDSLPRGLPPLTKAYRIHAKADRVGFTWPENEDVEKQVEAEWLELLDAMASDDAEAIEHEFGDHMFTLVELGRRKGIKAAPALNAATERFLTRFERMEALARERNLDFVSLSLDDKDDLWNEVKAAEKPETRKDGTKMEGRNFLKRFPRLSSPPFQDFDVIRSAFTAFLRSSTFIATTCPPFKKWPNGFNRCSKFPAPSKELPRAASTRSRKPWEGRGERDLGEEREPFSRRVPSPLPNLHILSSLNPC